MREVLRILPKRTVFRVNLATSSNYAGDFEMGEKEARTVLESAPSPDAYAMLVLAMSLSAQGRVSDALETYRALATRPALSTVSASGLGDLASYEGRFTDAVRILEEGAAADLAAKNPDRAAAKFVAQAFAHLQRGQKTAAIATAEKALSTSKAVKIRFLAARIFVDAGQQAKAQPVIEEFAAVQAEPQAYARIIEALIAMSGSDSRAAIRLLSEANALVNTWIGHYDLGRAYLAAGQYQQAESEFGLCLERRGEALSLFLDEEPTFGYFPLVHYQLGRTREAIGGDYAKSYRTYLTIREKAGEDPLLTDIRAKVR
jgi:tetratricopeptide (TPR) repeat protein